MQPAHAGECGSPKKNQHRQKISGESKSDYAGKAHKKAHWDCQPSTNHKKKEKKVRITIKKVAYGGNEKFRFHLTGNYTDEKFMLSNGSKTSFRLKPGTYAITEKDLPKGWRLTRIECGQGKRSGNRIVVRLEPKMPVECVFTNRKKRKKKGRITVRKIAVGGNDEFKFALVGSNTSKMFTLSNGGEASFVLKRGSYTIEEKSLPDGWSLDRVDCGQGDRTGNGIVVKLDPKKTIECVFTNRKTDDPDDPDEPKRFVKRRLDNLISHEPDRARLLRRLQEHQQQSIKDTPLKLAGTGATGTAPATGVPPVLARPPFAVGIAPSSIAFPRLKPLPADAGDDPDAQSGRAKGQPLFDTIAGYAEQLSAGPSQLRFGTSLSQVYALAQQAKAEEHKRKTAGSGFNFTGRPLTTPSVRPRPGFDVWIEGQASRYDDDVGGIDREGRFGVLYVGADYVVAPGILIGGIVQFDDTKEDLKGPGETGQIDGKGWMVGPYFGILLAENLMLDVRAAWGRSDNDIIQDDSVTGPNSASFDTTRWLTTAAITGSHYHGPWRISPRLAIAYGREQYDTFTNSAGVVVNGDEVAISRVTGSIEIGYRMITHSGTRIEPHASITGVYNFKDEDLLINGVVVEESKSRAKVEAGVLISLANGWGLRAAGHYDGLGDDDFHGYGGGLWVNIPLSRPR